MGLNSAVSLSSTEHFRDFTLFIDAKTIERLINYQ